MKKFPFTIESFAEMIPAKLLRESGKVFYSGRNAFSAPSALYVLGVNPGGDPSDYEYETVGNHTAAVLNSYPDDWSAFRDESWEGNPPGTYGMAPRVLHLLNTLGFNPGCIPCSNLVFVRSRREGDIHRDMTLLAGLCWPFHAEVIEILQPKVILCFGRTAGNYVKRQLGANTFLGEFVEVNNRRWRNQTFKNTLGLKVVIATHPSIADWCTPSTDPTPLVLESLN